MGIINTYKMDLETSYRIVDSGPICAQGTDMGTDSSQVLERDHALSSGQRQNFQL